MELKDLESDPTVHEKLSNFRLSIDKMENILENALSDNVMKDLNLKDKLNHDLFIAYMLNTLYWCYLRSKGLDPNTNKVKEEIARVRQYMISAKQAVDRHTIRKTVNQPVAERIIKHGIQKMDSGKGKRKFDGKNSARDGGTPKKQAR